MLCTCIPAAQVLQLQNLWLLWGQRQNSSAKNEDVVSLLLDLTFLHTQTHSAVNNTGVDSGGLGCVPPPPLWDLESAKRGGLPCA